MFLKSEVNLSPRELLYIAALLDAVEFLGVSDAFFGMEDDEIQQEVMQLQSSLEEKGYAEMDFDGSFALNDEVSELVDICANCDTFVVVDKNIVKNQPIRELYYAKSGSIVKLNEGTDGNILERMPTFDTLIKNISTDIEWQAPDASMLKDIKITNEVLSEVKAKAESFDEPGSMKILEENGCDKLSAEAILNGLIGRSDYFAVIIPVFGGEREGIYNFMLTSGESGIYKLDTITDEEQDAIQFRMLTSTEAEMTLKDIVDAAFSSEGEGGKND